MLSHVKLRFNILSVAAYNEQLIVEMKLKVKKLVKYKHSQPECFIKVVFLLILLTD